MQDITWTIIWIIIERVIEIVIERLFALLFALLDLPEATHIIDILPSVFPT